MTQNTSQTETQAPTARLVRDVESGQQSSGISKVLADVSTTMMYLYLRAQNRPAARKEGSA
jgi:hypothetical protein